MAKEKGNLLQVKKQRSFSLFLVWFVRKDLLALNELVKHIRKAGSKTRTESEEQRQGTCRTDTRREGPPLDKDKPQGAQCPSGLCDLQVAPSNRTVFHDVGDTMKYDDSYLRSKESFAGWLFLNHLSLTMTVDAIEKIFLHGKEKDTSFEDLRQLLTKSLPMIGTRAKRLRRSFPFASPRI